MWCCLYFLIFLFLFKSLQLIVVEIPTKEWTTKVLNAFDIISPIPNPCSFNMVHLESPQLSISTSQIWFKSPCSSIFPQISPMFSPYVSYFSRSRRQDLATLRCKQHRQADAAELLEELAQKAPPHPATFINLGTVTGQGWKKSWFKESRLSMLRLGGYRMEWEV